ncbi:Na+/H+ antiporter subunit E [Actinomycetospora soli]|uniref:Na+/H+ antiporter subunit E n=1 Tax=Actinomycetospora soli TaxID=2893887 RepID=UPI001E3DB36E|nr:Na+/H+ antiporter subunit E [Actinomycetospora soli]MCD2190880.1 Na+/H+ antiporter subunit E [Actinomycetospora soli]
MRGRVRPGPRLLRLAWLTLVWILLWGTFSWANLIGGIAVALFVVLLFPLPGIASGGRLRPLGLARVGLRIAGELVVSSLQVAWQSIRPGPPIRSSVVEVTFEERSELLMAALVEALSLVPGSVVVDADAERGVLWVHVLGADSDAEVEEFRAQVRSLEKSLLTTGIAAVRVERDEEGVA